MARTRWTNTFLDEMREAADPPADAVVGELFEDGEIAAVNRLMKTLVRNDGVPPRKLPRVVRDYLGATDDLPDWADADRIALGQRFFGVHGPICVMALACASLPACYAMRRGVQVLSLTARLQTDPVRRIGEVAQMTVHVMAPGGLEPAGAGVRDAQKVRLMHAAVRHLALAGEDWDADWGTPINQEDLAFTLMTFSVVVLDAIVKLGTTISDEEADAYFHCWNCVGHVLGVDRRLVADTIAGSRKLWDRITERNWEPCPEGVAMTHALIEAMEHAVPGTVFDGFPSYLVRHLLGDDVGDLLGVRTPGWTALLGGPLRLLARGSDAAGDAVPGVGAVAERFSRQLIEGFGWLARGGERAPFDIPAQLADRWGVTGARL